MPRRAQLSFLREWSMTRMHFGQWHECRWLSVNHTQCIRVIDHWSMTRMPTRAQLSFLRERSMTRMHFGQWHECRLMSVNHTLCIRVIDHRSMTRMPRRAQLSFLREWSMTRMHFGQWHGCRLLSVNHNRCICVIDHWSMTRMHFAGCNIHSVGINWLWFRLSQLLLGVIYTRCIRVIDRVIDRLYTMHQYLAGLVSKSKSCTLKNRIHGTTQLVLFRCSQLNGVIVFIS